MSEQEIRNSALESPYNIVNYQFAARLTAVYPLKHAQVYPLLGLFGEVGEFANKYKKILRDGAEFSRNDAIAELGDILWYFVALCSDMDILTSEVVEQNLRKLFDRQERGVLGGSGDNR